MRKSRDDRVESTARRYRDFAQEAAGGSPRYAELAGAIAGDDEILGFLSALPSPKRQPLLLFATAEKLLNRPADLAGLHGLLSERRRELARALLRS